MWKRALYFSSHPITTSITWQMSLPEFVKLNNDGHVTTHGSIAACVCDGQGTFMCGRYEYDLGTCNIVKPDI